LEAEAGIEPA